jgi:hypothetical protein
MLAAYPPLRWAATQGKHSMEIWFTAREKFDPSSGGAWDKYVQWAQLPQLREVISLDTALCPSVFKELTEEDWDHNIHQDHCISYFRDLDYVLSRVSDQRDSVNILAVVLEPKSNTTRAFDDERFVFYGYDLIDKGSDISALTNCGGFDKAFSSSDVSSVGLLEDYTFAKEVQRRLLQHYPEEPHADCALWAIWRLERFR